MAATVDEARRQGLELIEPDTVRPGDEVGSFIDRLGERPLLVVNDERVGELLGIITAFDLL
ncbi:MAG: hypothetical protein L0271_06000 [Gemmatimonadetes bacterium]|nr:hypothetical protein [Gemmatimonadota bacterium]